MVHRNPEEPFFWLRIRPGPFPEYVLALREKLQHARFPHRPLQEKSVYSYMIDISSRIEIRNRVQVVVINDIYAYFTFSFLGKI